MLKNIILALVVFQVSGTAFAAGGTKKAEPVSDDRAERAESAGDSQSEGAGADSSSEKSGGVSSRRNESDSGHVPYSALNDDERKIMNRGEVSTEAWIIGGAVGTLTGLGIGQAIQGRYMPNGLIFTLGEIGAAGLLVAGATDCLVDDINYSLGTTTRYKSCSNGAVVVGYLALVGLRIWEIVDLWAGPPGENHRYRDLKERVDGAPKVSYFVVPRELRLGAGPSGASGFTGGDSRLGVMAGAQIRF